MKVIAEVFASNRERKERIDELLQNMRGKEWEFHHSSCELITQRKTIRFMLDTKFPDYIRGTQFDIINFHYTPTQDEITNACTSTICTNGTILVKGKFLI